MVDQEQSGGDDDHAVPHVLALVPSAPDILRQRVRGRSNPVAVLDRQEESSEKNHHPRTEVKRGA